MASTIYDLLLVLHALGRLGEMIERMVRAGQATVTLDELAGMYERARAQTNPAWAAEAPKEADE